MCLKGNLHEKLLTNLKLVDSPNQADIVIVAAPRSKILEMAETVEDGSGRIVVVSDFTDHEKRLLTQEGLEALSFFDFEPFIRNLTGTMEQAEIEEIRIEPSVVQTPIEPMQPVEPVVPPAQLGGGKVVPVGSTKGGVGKSTIAVNLAVHLSKYGKTVLVDFDANHGDVPITTYLDRPAPVTVTGWDPNRDLIVSPKAPNLWVLPFSDKVPKPYMAGEVMGVEILTMLKTRFDYIIVDLGVFSDLWCINAAVKASDQIILVVDQSDKCLIEMTSFIHLESNHISRGKMKLMINKVGLEPIHTPNEVQRHLGFISHFEVPFDQMVSRAVEKRTFPVLMSKSKAGRSMRGAFGEMFGYSRESVPWYKRLFPFSRRVAG